MPANLQRPVTAADDLTVSSDPASAHALRPRAALEVTAPAAPQTEHVLVRIGGGRYGIRATDVAQVAPVPELTRLPGTPPWLSGVGNWRGHVLPVIDLRPLLAAEVSASPTSARVVVLVVGEVEVGLLTDMVTGLAALPDDCPAPPATVTGSAAELLRGVAPGDAAGPIGVLDTAAIVAIRDRLPRRRGRGAAPMAPSGEARSLR
jgi:purine-binding chemotaxis protein CheW